MHSQESFSRFFCDQDLMDIPLFSKLFALFLDLRGILSEQGEMGDVCMFQGQTGKNCPLKPWEIGHFPVSALFCGLSHPHKMILLKLARKGLSFQMEWYF